MLAKLHFDVQIVQDESVTAAVLDTGPEQPYKPVGSAKRHPTDQFHTNVGQMLALSRLFQKIADDYADGATKLMDAPEFAGVKFLTKDDPVMRAWLEEQGVPAREL